MYKDYKQCLQSAEDVARQRIDARWGAVGVEQQRRLNEQTTSFYDLEQTKLLQCQQDIDALKRQVSELFERIQGYI